MAKIDKILERWKRGPSEVDKDEVLAVLSRYDFSCEHKRGSHIIVRHKRLVGEADYGAEGEFTVPVKGGQHVKGFYIKNILRAIKIVEEAEQ